MINAPTQFQVGTTYSTPSICDSETIFRFKVVGRSAKQIVIEYHGKTFRRGVRFADGVEHCNPLGTYSMAPVIRADNVPQEKLPTLGEVMGLPEVTTERGTHVVTGNNLLAWDMLPSENFARGWFIGSEGDNGEHLRERTGWPYSIYRKNIAVGGVDHVLCHGIQHEGDAEALCHILNLRIAGAAQ